jgi:capsid protein
MLQTWRAMQGRKKKFADRQATEMYTLWLEEQIQRGEVPLPPGFDKWDFYRGLNREAMSRCSWIGASRGQIDELKETQAAVARIKAGLSTHEDEIARLGGDYREVFEQALREQQERAAAGLVFPDLDAKAAPAIQSGNAPNEP